MQARNPVLFYSISGVAAARTKPLYEAIRASLPKVLPSTKIAFVGCPFYIKERRKFPLPLLWGLEERGQHTTTRLFNCWKRLNEFAVTKLRSALAESDVVIVHRFGLDAQLYATACCDSVEAINEAERVHHALVQLRVKEQGVSPPQYIIPSADVDDTDNLLRAFPNLVGTPHEVLQSFMQHELRTLERYFDPKHGQKKPHLLPVSMSIEDMCNNSIELIASQVRQRDVA